MSEAGTRNAGFLPWSFPKILILREFKGEDVKYYLYTREWLKNENVRSDGYVLVVSPTSFLGTIIPVDQQTPFYRFEMDSMFIHQSSVYLFFPPSNLPEKFQPKKICLQCMSYQIDERKECFICIQKKFISYQDAWSSNGDQIQEAIDTPCQNPYAIPGHPEKSKWKYSSNADSRFCDHPTCSYSNDMVGFRIFPLNIKLSGGQTINMDKTELTRSQLRKIVNTVNTGFFELIYDKSTIGSTSAEEYFEKTWRSRKGTDISPDRTTKYTFSFTRALCILNPVFSSCLGDLHFWNKSLDEIKDTNLENFMLQLIRLYKDRQREYAPSSQNFF